jgi:hypothetical protein
MKSFYFKVVIFLYFVMIPKPPVDQVERGGCVCLFFPWRRWRDSACCKTNEQDCTTWLCLIGSFHVWDVSLLPSPSCPQTQRLPVSASLPSKTLKLTTIWQLWDFFLFLTHFRLFRFYLFPFPLLEGRIFPLTSSSKPLAGKASLAPQLWSTRSTSGILFRQHKVLQ